MGWVIAAAMIVGLAAALIAGTVRDDQRQACLDDPPTRDDAVCEPSPLVAHPRLTGLVAGVATLAVGSLVVINVSFDRRS